MAERRVSIGEAVRESLDFWRRSWRQVAGALGVVAALIVADEFAPEGAAAVVVSVLYLFATVMAEGALFRLALQPQDAGPVGPGGLQWGRLEWRLLAVSLLTYALVIFLVMVGGLVLAAVAAGFATSGGATDFATPQAVIAAIGPTGRAVLGALLAGAAILLVWLGARLSLALPATAAQGRVRLLSTWPLTKGSALVIFATSVVLTLPIIVVTALIAALSGAISGEGAASDAAGAVMAAVATFFYVPIAVGFLSYFYRRLTHDGAA